MLTPFMLLILAGFFTFAGVLLTVSIWSQATPKPRPTVQVTPAKRPAPDHFEKLAA